VFFDLPRAVFPKPFVVCDIVCLGEELDISHPVLTELDTSQIIRSYIGVELTAGLDHGSVTTTSDDQASSTAMTTNFNSELDVSWSTDDDSDNVSVHIRFSERLLRL